MKGEVLQFNDMYNRPTYTVYYTCVRYLAVHSAAHYIISTCNGCCVHQRLFNVAHASTFERVRACMCTLTHVCRVGWGNEPPLRVNGRSYSQTYHFDVLMLSYDCRVVMLCIAKTLVTFDSTKDPIV